MSAERLDSLEISNEGQTGGWSGYGIALGMRVGQWIADPLLDAPLPLAGVQPDASAD